jgi:inward rectifier potassium channel
VSRPSARIGFSERALIAPYQDGVSLQFRVVNRRANSLIEPEVAVVFMTVDRSNGTLRREYTMLNLERSKVYFFPLTWTIVHPIDSTSPLSNKGAAELAKLEAELMILVKAWDETFSQTVHQRYSYRYDEIVWNARFKPAFTVGSEGRLVLDVGQVGAHAEVARSGGGAG